MTTPDTEPAVRDAIPGSHDIPLRASGPAIATAEAASIGAPVSSAPPAKRKRPVVAIVTIILLLLALITAIVFLVIYLGELSDANDLIDEQKQEIEDQQELIDKKETFGAAMMELLDTASTFEGTLYGTIVPTDSYTLTASRAWTHRWDLADLDEDIATIREDTAELQAIIDAAAIEASTNTTGSVYESVTDSLGQGYVSSLLYDADTFCESDVIACVSDDDPYTVHFDLADNNVEYTNDFIRTGVAYHEFAHVLQITNPELTEVALDSFDGDHEIMADCFALTYLDGWTLEHRVYITSYSWWEVNIGYGYTCDESQRQVVRDWYTQLGYKSAPISQ